MPYNMRFKKLFTYKFDEFFDVSDIETRALDNLISTANTNTPLVTGVAYAFPGASIAAIVNDACVYMRFAADEKKISKSDVQERLQKKKDEYELMNGSKMSCDMTNDARDAIELELISRAEPKRSYVQVIIDNKNRLLHTDATSSKDQETMFKVLIKVFGSAPISSLLSKCSLATYAKEWLQTYEFPDPLVPGTYIKYDDGQVPVSTISMNNLPVLSDDIVRHAGDYIIKVLGMGWRDWSFKFDSKINALTSLKHNDSKAFEVLLGENGGEGGDPVQELVANMLVLRSEFKQLNEVLLSAMPPLEEEAGKKDKEAA